jgi:hypothetical protein
MTDGRRRFAVRDLLPRLDPTVRDALLLAVVSRVMLFALVWLSLRVIPRLPPYAGQGNDSLLPKHPSLDGWTRWDAIHYVAIASDGYPDGNGVAFFPLFPLLIRVMVSVVGAPATAANLAAAGIAIANLCFILAVPLLARLTANRFGEEAGRTAALLLCITPFGFFFSAAYTESTFLLLALATFTFAQRGQWSWAALAAGLASATRLFGLALVPALLIMAWRRPARSRDLVTIALLGPAGTLAYFAYCGWTLGNPAAPLDAQEDWGGWNLRFWHYVKLLSLHPRATLWGDPRELSIVLNVAIAALFLMTLPWVWRLLDPGLALFTTTVLGQVFVSWVSLGRYLLPAVGVYIIGGFLLTRPGWRGWPRDAIVLGSAILLGVLAVLYSHGYWIV